MIKLNNKGQSLVMFILIIPILLLIMVLVIDVGNIIVDKLSLDNTNYLAMEYALENINDSELQSKIIDMIYLNNKNLTYIYVDVSNEKIYIETKKKTNGFLSSSFNLSSSYEGYFENNNKKIKKG